MHHEGPPRAEARETAGDEDQQLRPGHSHHLGHGLRGVRERAEQVEGSAHPELPPWKGRVAGRGVEGGGEEKRPAHLVEAALHLLDGSVDAHPQGLEHVGAAAAPARRAVAVLRHLHPAGGHHQGGHRRDVEGGGAVTPRAAGVHRFGSPKGQGARAHGAREAHHLVLGLAAYGEGREERPDLGRGGFTIHDDGHGRPRLLLAEALPAQDPRQVLLHRRKLRSRSLPAVVMMLSGWNCTPSRGRVLWRRPITTPSSVQAETRRQSGTESRATTSEW